MPNDLSPDALIEDRGQWQAAVDAAHGKLCLLSARDYGLDVGLGLDCTGWPEIDPDDCVETLRRGKAIGVVPAADAADRFIDAILTERVG